MVEQAGRTPCDPAVRCGNATLTYKDLMVRARELAGSILATGAALESKIALLLSRTEDVIVAQMGVMLAGCAFLPLESTWPDSRIAVILEDAGCLCIVLHERHRQLIPSAFKGAVISIDVEDDRRGASVGNQQVPAAFPHPDNAAYVLYTSGTTGTPKGVVVEHRNVHNAIISYLGIFGLHACTKWAYTCSYVFDVTFLEVYTPLVSGGSVIVCNDPFSMPDDAVVFGSVASALALLPQVPAAAEVAVQIGEAFTPAAVSNVRAVPKLLNAYGPTEAAVTITYKWVEGYACDTIGVLHPNCQCHIVDPETLQLQPLGVLGELLIGGTQVARGYLKRPELTAEKFINCPWNDDPGRLYRTGDLARWLPCGELAFHGRIDSQVKLRGFRIELGEVEVRPCCTMSCCDLTYLLVKFLRFFASHVRKQYSPALSLEFTLAYRWSAISNMSEKKVFAERHTWRPRKSVAKSSSMRAAQRIR